MSNTNISVKVKVQRFGAFLSAEVMPNIGVFIGWGILAALFIPTGWLPNETLNQLVAPTMKYLMPSLIAYTGGSNVYGKRGGVIGAMATMGVILGSDVNMLAGSMLMGPLAAWCLKKVDKLFEDHIKPGMEMMVNNFSLGILGAILMIIGFFTFAPVIQFLINLFSIGINWLISHQLLPFMSFLIQPGKVLFLNNAINHGIMIPLGTEQAAETGKSILFMLEANNGTVFGTALAFALFAKGTAKKAAPGAAIINFFGGIGEVVYPFVLAQPITLIGMIAGSFVSIFIVQNFGGGTVAAISPGSFFALCAVSAKSSIIVNIISYFAGAGVACVVNGILLKTVKSGEEDSVLEQNFTSGNITSADVKSSVLTQNRMDPAKVSRFLFACDAGMGSSVMAESIMKTQISKAALDVDVAHSSVADLDENVRDQDVIITSKPLADRVKVILAEAQKDNRVVPIANLLDAAIYQELINELK